MALYWVNCSNQDEAKKIKACFGIPGIIPEGFVRLRTDLGEREMLSRAAFRTDERLKRDKWDMLLNKLKEDFPNINFSDPQIAHLPFS